MKKIYYTLIALVFTTVTLAQGIAVQGIARDDNKAAITQTTLNFTFRILATDNSQRYTENASIRTDNFGVFSHIVGTGTKLNGLDFSEQGLRIEVSVLYPTKVVVYDEGFNYTPYAHYAANGAPTGSIMPYMGETAPVGWLLCDGRDIPSQYTTLRAMFDNNKTPNLIGRFLKGAGTGGDHNAIATNTFDETTLGEYQEQSLQNHKHNQGTLKTNEDGAHVHRIPHRNTGTPSGTDSTGGENEWGEQRSSDLNGSSFEKRTRNGDGSHSHNITGETSGVLGGSVVKTTTEETKPNNFSVNYIIKL
jgi:microcystin-dependent protein